MTALLVGRGDASLYVSAAHAAAVLGECCMVIVPEVRVSVDERALTARVEVSLPSRMAPLAFTVDPARDGHGWEIREPLGGALAWRDSFETAVGVAVAAANGALGSGQRSSLP